MSVGVLEISDGTESGIEVVGDINGDGFPRLKVGHILVDELGGGDIIKLYVESPPTSRLLRRRKNPLDREPACDRLGDFHLIVKKFYDGELH